MTEARAARILKNADYLRLTRVQNRLAASLSALAVGGFFLLVLVMGLHPEVLTRPLFEGSAFTRGYPAAAVIFVLVMLAIVLYVWASNAAFDKLREKIAREAAE